MVDCNTLNLTRRGGRKGLAIGSGRGRRGRARHGYLSRDRWVPSYASATVQTGTVARGCGPVYLVPRSHWDRQTGTVARGCGLVYLVPRSHWDRQTGTVARGCGLVYLVPRSSDDGGKYSARCVIAGEPSLAHSRPVVDHQGGNFVVCHFSLLN